MYFWQEINYRLQAVNKIPQQEIQRIPVSFLDIQCSGFVILCPRRRTEPSVPVKTVNKEQNKTCGP